jgi:peroxiredoxin
MVFRSIAQIGTIIALTVSLAPIATAQTSKITLRSVEGNMISLDKHRGEPVVLVFNATWFPMANRSLPALQRIANLYENQGVLFYWVSINNDRAGEKGYIADADLKAFAKENGLEVSVLRDPEKTALHHFGLDAVPSFVIIDRVGELWHRQTGFDTGRAIGYARMMNLLNKLLRNDPSTLD